MSTTDITVCLSMPDGKKSFTGRGFIEFPFVVHRPIIGDELRGLELGGRGWKVTHLASGRVAAIVATIADAKKAIEVLGQHSLFYMPDTKNFMSLCRVHGAEVTGSMKAAGYDGNTGRFSQ